MITCKEVLLDYINTHEGWQKKVHLYAVAEDWSPETVGRDLRDLHEEGKIQVGYYLGTRTKRNLAMYAKKDYIRPQKKVEIVEINGERIARMI